MNHQHHEEGQMTRQVEEETKNIPSGMFLCAALTCMATSISLKCMKKQHLALLVGQWTAPLLLFGIYNKIVKTHDSGMETRGDERQGRRKRFRY